MLVVSISYQLAFEFLVLLIANSMVNLQLVNGRHHCLSGLHMFKNSALPSRDGYPLGGQGNIMRYSFKDKGVLQFSSAPVEIGQDTRGFMERTHGELTNYSNTSIVPYKDHLLSLFDNSYPYVIDPETLETISRLPIKSSAHIGIDNDVLYTFSHTSTGISIKQLYNPASITHLKAHIPLDGQHFLHDMCICDGLAVLPIFPCAVDMLPMALGFRNIVESIQFSYPSNTSFVIYDMHTSGTHIINVPSITSPTFHVVGKRTGSRICLYAFSMPELFSLADITDKHSYNSTCRRIIIDNYILSSVDELEFKGDMPTVCDEYVSYVRNVKGNGIIVQVRWGETMSYCREFNNAIAEEPLYATSASGQTFLIQVVHDTHNTALHILDINTLKSISEYTMPRVPFAFHGSVL